MKKVFLFIAAFCMLASSFASVSPEKGKFPPLKAAEIFIPVGKTGTKISLLDLSRISVTELEQLTGNKMKMADRLGFKVAQKKLRDNIDKDGIINSKKMEKFFNKRAGETGFHFGGFALGLFLGLIGVLIAYLIKDDYKQNRVKWSWIGFGIAVVINVIYIVTVL